MEPERKAAPPSGEGPRDVRASLAEMDRKLRELQEELTVAGRGRSASHASSAAPAETAVVTAPVAAPAAPVAPSATATEAPVAPTPAPAPSPAPGAGYAAATPDQALRSAEAQAQAIVARAEQEAARMLEEAHARVGELSRQIDSLVQLRDHMQRTMRQALEDYEQGLARVDTATHPVAAPAAGHAPGPVPLPSVLPPVVPADAPALEPVATPAAGSATAPLAAPAPVAAAPTAVGVPAAAGTETVVAEAPVAAAPPPAPPAQEVFDGRVELDAGPFDDIGGLTAFEQALGQLADADDVYVRGFEGNRAQIDLRLTAPTRLLEELRTRVPFDIRVDHAEENTVVLSVGHHAQENGTT